MKTTAFAAGDMFLTDTPASQAPASAPPTGPMGPMGPEWPGLLAELSRQLDAGRVEVCDLPAITAEFDTALAAINRYLLF